MSLVDTTTPGTAIAMSGNSVSLMPNPRKLKQQLTPSPYDAISFRSINKRRRALRDCVVVVPCHIRCIRDGRIDLKYVNQSVSIVGINGADLVGVCACVPNPIE